MDNLISRQAAIDVLEERIHANGYSNVTLVSELNRSIGYLMQLPSAQPDVPDTNVGDMISRKAAIDSIMEEPSEARYPAFYAEKIKQLPPAQPDLDEWCTDCKEYDSEKHCCPRWNRVIRNALNDARPEPRWIPVDGKERLPKEGQRVLVTDEDGEIDIAHIIDYSDIGEGIEWWAHDYKCYPIAWSELPTAYERSEDE